MRLTWAWISGIFGIVGSALLVVQEHLDVARANSVDWLLPAVKFFNYPAFLITPWIVDHAPFIRHQDMGPNVAEVYLFDGLYILFSGLEWFLLGAIVTLVLRRLHRQ